MAKDKKYISRAGRRSYAFSIDHIHAVEVLSDRQAGKLLFAILQYMNGKAIDITDRQVRLVFLYFKREIDNQNYNLGAKHHNWKGGITPANRKIRNSPEIKEWRKAVIARDNYTCQHCKKRGGRLHAHHLFDFANHPDKRTEITNGLTLCVDCHRKVHTKNGK